MHNCLQNIREKQIKGKGEKEKINLEKKVVNNF